MCQWCLTPLLRQDCTADHIIPSSRRGSNFWNNLLVSCHTCNHSRNNKKVIDKKGRWCDESIPKPHGPVWNGPSKSIVKLRPLGFWCDCHAFKQNMKLFIENDIDIFDLFVISGKPYINVQLAMAIEKRLKVLLRSDVPIIETDGTRLIIELHGEDTSIRYDKPYQSPEEFKESIPAYLTRMLERLNREDITIKA